VTDQINDRRYPSFKGIMAAKKKPVQTWSLADLEIDRRRGPVRGLVRGGRRHRAPAAPGGQVVTDDGRRRRKLVEFLAGAKLV
jgi:electron transfer flavoprotein beta subunit